MDNKERTVQDIEQILVMNMDVVVVTLMVMESVITIHDFTELFDLRVIVWHTRNRQT